MSAIRVGRHAGATVLPDPLAGVRAATASMVTTLARWLHNRAGQRQLSALSDDQLRDLGIARADIGRVAWHGRA